VLAEMAVHQTRAFFFRRDGQLVDNPKVGPTLAAEMWAPGNSQPFLGLVEKLTGQPLDGAAWVAQLAAPTEARVAAERGAYDAALAAATESAAAATPAATPAARTSQAEEVDLAMRVRLVDGDFVIADTADSGSFLAACATFEAYIADRFSLPPSPHASPPAPVANARVLETGGGGFGAARRKTKKKNHRK
jgi:hypothetical protein